MARICQTGWEPGHIGVMDVAAGSGSVVTTPLPGSWSSYAHNGGSGGSPSQIGFDTATTEIYFGCRVYSGTVSSWSADNRMLGFGAPALEHVRLSTGTSAHVQVRRADGTNLQTGTFTFVANTWYYLQGHVIVSDSVGVFELLIDGVQDINVTGADTRNGGADANMSCCRFTSDTNRVYDDFYVNDTTGSNNGYSGEQRIYGFLPNAAGDNTGLTRGGTDSGNNYGQVDERPPNDGTDYVFGTDTSSYDLYNIPDTSGVSLVQATTLWLRAAKSDASAASIAHMLKSGGTENQGSDLALTTSYVYYRKNYNVDPTDSAAWTPSKVDGLQIGEKSR